MWLHFSSVSAKGEQKAGLETGARDGDHAYVLGLSYGAVEIVLSSLGVGIGKTSIDRAVQAAAEKVPGMKREKLLEGYRTKALGADIHQCALYWEMVTDGD